MVIPKGMIVHEGLSTSFTDIHELLNDLHQNGFTGYCQVNFGEYQGTLFLNRGQVINALEKDAYQKTIGEDAIKNILTKAKQKDGTVGVSRLPDEIIVILLNIINGKLLYQDLLSEFTTLENLLVTLKTKALFGVVEVSLSNDRGNGYIYFQNGGVIKAVFWTSGEEMILGLDGFKNIINLCSEVGATFNVYETETREEFEGMEKLPGVESLLAEEVEFEEFEEFEEIEEFEEEEVFEESLEKFDVETPIRDSMSSEQLLNISALPDDILYTQYLIREFLTYTQRRKKLQKSESTSIELSSFAKFHLNLFTMEEALHESDLTVASKLMEELAQKLHHIFETHIARKAADIRKRLDLIEDSLPSEMVKHFHGELGAIVSGDFADYLKSIETLTNIAKQIRQTFAPRQQIVCKVNVFAHGHRDVFDIAPHETLENLAEKVKTKYAKDISGYLYNIHKQRIPLSEVRLSFFSDALNVSAPYSPLHMNTVLFDIPERETEGVTWYPEWIKADDESIYITPVKGGNVRRRIVRRRVVRRAEDTPEYETSSDSSTPTIVPLDSSRLWNVSEIFQIMRESFLPEESQEANAHISYKFVTRGQPDEHWVLKIENGTCEVIEGEDPSASTHVKMKAETLLKIVTGQIDHRVAFMLGKIKVKGDKTYITTIRKCFSILIP